MLNLSEVCSIIGLLRAVDKKYEPEFILTNKFFMVSFIDDIGTDHYATFRLNNPNLSRDLKLLVKKIIKKIPNINYADDYRTIWRSVEYAPQDDSK